MRPTYELKIDAYAHIIPPKYRELFYKINPEPDAPAYIAKFSEL